MMDQSHINDILIGDDKWIKFIDLNGRYEQSLDIDYLISSLSFLWDTLEQHCVAECCGFNAFDFYPDAIYEATKNMDKEQIRAELERVIESVTELETTVVSSSRLNNLADKSTFISLLLHIKESI